MDHPAAFTIPMKIEILTLVSFLDSGFHRSERFGIY